MGLELVWLRRAREVRRAILAKDMLYRYESDRNAHTQTMTEEENGDGYGYLEMRCTEVYFGQKFLARLFGPTDDRITCVAGAT